MFKNPIGRVFAAPLRQVESVSSPEAERADMLFDAMYRELDDAYSEHDPRCAQLLREDSLSLRALEEFAKARGKLIAANPKKADFARLTNPEECALKAFQTEAALTRFEARYDIKRLSVHEIDDATMAADGVHQAIRGRLSLFSQFQAEGARHGSSHSQRLAIAFYGIDNQYAPRLLLNRNFLSESTPVRMVKEDISKMKQHLEMGEYLVKLYPEQTVLPRLNHAPQAVPTEIRV